MKSLLKSLVILSILSGCASNVDSAPKIIDSVDEPAPSAEPAPLPPETPQPLPPKPSQEAKKPGPPLAPLRVWISPDVSKQEEVKDAVAGWAETTKGVRDWVLVDATPDEVADADAAGKNIADVSIFEIGPYGGTCGGTGDGTSGALGCTWGIGGLWYNESGQAMPVFLIDTTFSADGHAEEGYQQNAKLVAEHEIGHLLGLTHHDGGIMQAGATKAALAADWDCPDPDSVQRLEDHLKITGLHSCPVPDGVF